MKYLKTYESYRNTEPVNEELIGKLFDFLKNMWGRALEDIKKLGQNPTMEQLDKWLEENTFNRNSNNYLFKSIMDEFKKEATTNTERCLDLVGSILDPVTGQLGEQGLQPFYDGLLKVFGKNLAPIETIKYYFITCRNRAIKDYKYAGGPDAGKVDQDKINKDINDKTHLPDFKNLLKGANGDEKKMKDITIKWVEGTLIPRIIKYIQEIKKEDIDEYLKSKNIKTEVATEYKVGDTVIYKRRDFNQTAWDAISDDEKKKTNEGKVKDLVDKEQIGILKITKIEGNNVTFKGTQGDINKTLDDILIKVDGAVEGQEDLVNTLKDIKTKNPEAIQKIGDVSKLYEDPQVNKTKIEEIEKIIST